MARPIRETPILFGEDARRFEERMKQKRSETPEQRRLRLEHYHTVLEWFKKGDEYETELRARKSQKADA